MNDALLTSEDRAEALSRAYAQAVAASAGYTTSEMSMDRDGVDLRIHAGGEMRPAVDLQLKATRNLSARADGEHGFALKRRNYDLLRLDAQTPRVLVVLDLPDDENEWMTITADDLVLRKRAYWLSLRGWPETENRASITVGIPAENVFDVENLRDLMERSRRGSVE